MHLCAEMLTNLKIKKLQLETKYTKQALISSSSPTPAIPPGGGSPAFVINRVEVIKAWQNLTADLIIGLKSQSQAVTTGRAVFSYF